MLKKCLLFCFFALSLKSNSQNLDFKTANKTLKKSSDFNKIEANLYLSDYFIATKLDSAFLFAKNAVKLSEKSKIDSLMAKTYNAYAICFEYEGQLDSSKIYHLKALKKRLKIKDKLGIADSYNNIGIIAEQKGQFEEATKLYFKALNDYEILKDSSKMAMVYSNLGITFKQMQNFKKSYSYYLKANGLYKKIKNDFGQTVTAGNIGSVLLDLKNFELSKKYSLIAAKGYVKLKYDRYVPYALSNYAIALDCLKQFDLAEKKYQEVLVMHQIHKNEGEYLNIGNALANCYIKQKKFKDSEVILNKIKPEIDKTSAYRQKSQSYNYLAKTYFGLNMSSKAYLYLEKYANLKDSLLHNEALSKSLELEKKYETEKKENELLKAKAKVIEKALKEKKRTNQLIITLSLLGLLFVIGIMIFKQQKLKENQLINEAKLKEAIHKIETQNQLQSQRLRISRDLHDNIGSHLTYIISSIENMCYAFKNQNDVYVDKLKKISLFTSSTITELRDTIWAMNLSTINFEDLKIRLISYIDKMKEAKENISFHINFDQTLNDNFSFSSIEGMNIYRLIQEAVNNSIKYAEPTNICLDFTEEKSQIKIIYTDDGKGFNLSDIELGNGLLNMQKRAKEIQANIEIISEISKGCKIILTLNKSK